MIDIKDITNNVIKFVDIACDLIKRDNSKKMLKKFPLPDYQIWKFSYNECLDRIEFSVIDFATGKLVFHATTCFTYKIFPFTLYWNKDHISNSSIICIEKGDDNE